MSERSERMKVASDALLACPFCGAPGTFEPCHGGVRIGCRTRGCIAEVVWGAKWINDRNGVEAWNRRYEPLLAALRALSSDMHQRSDRPCSTCRAVSVAISEPFGCYAYQAARGIKSDLRLSQANVTNQTRSEAE